MKYLSDYTEQGQTNLFNKTGAFFAFSQEQFNESKKEGAKYVNCGQGLLCEQENVKELLEGLENIQVKGIQQDFEENGAEGIIQREYFNYESHISMDLSSVKDVLKQYQEFYPEEFSDNIITEEFSKCWNRAVELDLF